MPAGVHIASPTDLSQIVTLYSRVYPKVNPASLESRASYLRQLLFEHPWRSSGLSSLVYEDKAGHIIGFLGVIPRPMMFHDKPITMAISHNFMVDPTNRNTLAGVALAKAFFSGKQMLSITQPQNGPSRKVWKAFGAASVALQGLSWVWPLRPASYLVDRLRERKLSAVCSTILKPVCWLLDAAGTRVVTQQSQGERTSCIRENLSLEDLLACIDESSQPYALRPVYDLATLKWLLTLLLQKKKYGELRKQCVRLANGQRIGYYVYYAKPKGISYVLHIGARAGMFGTVLDDLGRDAAERSAVALSGWVDARYIEEVSARAFYLKHRCDDPLLTQTLDPEVQTCLESGNTFLTPTESEWWTWFPDVVVNNTPAIAQN